MQTYGPLTLTANTITSVGVPPSSAFVYVGNDSPYDVLVAFTPYQPAVVTQATGDWSGVVQAMHHGNFPTPANIQSPLGGGFAGKVWLLPLNTRGASLSTTGSISSLAQAWVIATAPGEQPPDAYAAPRQTDLASQPRVIAIPVSTNQTATGSGVYTAADPAQDISLMTVTGPLSNNQTLSVPFVMVYIHSLLVQTTNSTALQFGIVTKCYSPLAVLLQTNQIFNAMASSTALIFTPAFPFVYKLAVPDGVNYITAYLRPLAISANPTNVMFDAAMDADMVSLVPVPPAGGGNSIWPVSGYVGGTRF